MRSRDALVQGSTVTKQGSGGCKRLRLLLIYAVQEHLSTNPSATIRTYNNVLAFYVGSSQSWSCGSHCLMKDSYCTAGVTGVITSNTLFLRQRKRRAFYCIATSTRSPSHKICIPHHRKYASYTYFSHRYSTTTYLILLTDIDLRLSNVASCLIYFNWAAQPVQPLI